MYSYSRNDCELIANFAMYVTSATSTGNNLERRCSYVLQFAAVIREEITKWGAVVRSAGAKID